MRTFTVTATNSQFSYECGKGLDWKSACAEAKKARETKALVVEIKLESKRNGEVPFTQWARTAADQQFSISRPSVLRHRGPRVLKDTK